MSKSSGGGSTTSQTSQSGRSRLPVSGRNFSTSDDPGRLATYKESLRAIRELPKVEFRLSSEHMQAKAELGLSNISDNEFAAMFGALDGSVVSVKRVGPDLNDWNVTIYNKFLSSPSRRIIYFDEDGGALTIENSELKILPKYQNNKLGTFIFGKQVYYARKNNVGSINTYGYTDSESNGGYTWPVLGYDRLLRSKERDSAKELFGNVTTVRDILDQPGGNTYWSANHSSGALLFDLQKNSRNSKALRNYIKNNIKVKNIKFLYDLSKES